MAIVLSNPLRSGSYSALTNDGDPLALHRSIPGYRPTPLVVVPTLAADLGLGALWVKDESSRLGLPAFKVLGASWATYRALSERLGRDPALAPDLEALRGDLRGAGPLTLVTATDGNHGRAVAHVARLLGLAARILMPAGTAPARVAAIEGEGADVTVIEGSYDDAVAQAASLADARTIVVSDTSWPGYHDVPGWVVEGYSTIFREIDDELQARGEVRPDVVVIQSGVGSLAVAAIDHYRSDASLEIVVVEPTTAACALRSAEAGHPVTVPGPHPSIMAGLNCGTVSELAWPRLAAGVDTFVAVEDADAERAMRDLAAAGIVSGETGASGLAGLRAMLADGAGRDRSGLSALVLNTEGATDPQSYERIVGHPPRPSQT